MNDEQARHFAQRMIETWPTGPRRNVWRDIALKLHDHDAARSAYAELERTAAYISTAQFHDAYTAITRRRDHTHTGAGAPCGDCDDTGWVSAPDRVWPDERTSTQVQPCPHCPEGAQRARSRIWTERHHHRPPIDQNPHLFGALL